MQFIKNEKRLLRPDNFLKTSSWKGDWYLFLQKIIKRLGNKFNGKYFYEKSDDVFEACKKIFQNNIKLKNDADFIVVDIHGEITSEKMAMGYFFDGKATIVIGTHTHVPTSDGQNYGKRYCISNRSWYVWRL